MPVPSAITDLSTTPASNSPAGSESPATTDDYLRTHAAFIAQLRAALASAYATASGTANAIVLTTNATAAKQTALVSGHMVRARIAATNTGATTMALDGLTARTCVTVTGVALPAGYIRTGVDTEFTYDSAGDRWIVGREAEYGSNANGDYWKYADGRLVCKWRDPTLRTTATAAGALWAMNSSVAWTYPAEYKSGTIPNVMASCERISGAISHFAGLADTPSNTSANYKAYSAASGSTGYVQLTAEGVWY